MVLGARSLKSFHLAKVTVSAGLRGESGPCLFQLLEAAGLPGLVAT